MIAEKAQEAIELAVNFEHNNITTKYGDTYNSRHEAYAVLHEEIEEVFEAYKEMNILGDLWQAIRSDADKEQMLELVKTIKSNSVDMIEEGVQCAAVCERFIETLEREEKREGLY